MPDVPRLAFLPNEAGEREGLADAGIEHFRDAPYESCAREAGQNSRDAAAALPVRLTFNVLRLNPQELPFFDDLLAAVTASASGADGEKEEEFFTNALHVLRNPPIPVLEIADYNTTGLLGPPNKSGTRFHSLLKSAGVSKKDSDTSGGSFGIGKNAAFAVSDLQLVLYSTLYDEKGIKRFAAQGKTKLISHVDSSGSSRRQTGYWGLPSGFRAIEELTAVPSWLRRNSVGTSIYSIGFRESDDWAEHITSSLISNFFVAVYRGEMEFEVDDSRIHINSNTIEALFSDDSVRAAAEKSGHLLDLEFSAQMLRCLMSPNATEDKIDASPHGAFSVRVLVDDGLPRRVGFVRNGMYITDNLRHFDQPLAKFPSSRDFIALVEPADDEASRLLKRLENPAHNNFSAQRITDPAKRAIAERVMKRLGKKLRELIRSTTGVETQDSVALNELAAYFAESTASRPRSDDGEKDPDVYEFVAPKVRRARSAPPKSGKGAEGGSAGRRTGEGGNRAGHGTSYGDGTGGQGSRAPVIPVPLGTTRNIIRSGPDGAEATARLLLFTPSHTGRIRIALYATGLSEAEPLRVISSSEGTIVDGEVEVGVTDGTRSILNVGLAVPYSGPLDIVAYAVAEE